MYSNCHHNTLIEIVVIATFIALVVNLVDREKVGAVTDFIFLGSKNPTDSDCSHEIKDSCSLEENLWQI